MTTDFLNCLKSVPYSQMNGFSIFVYCFPKMIFQFLLEKDFCAIQQEETNFQNNLFVCSTG